MRHPTQHRLPRFTRVDRPPPMVLTRRDLAILRQVAAYRFLTSRQIVRLMAAMPQVENPVCVPGRSTPSVGRDRRGNPGADLPVPFCKPPRVPADLRAQPVLRRLQRLFHHGYLDRPRAQIDYFHQGGSRPLIYGLGRRSVAVLYPEGDTRPRTENLHVGRLHLEHTVLTAEVLITLELACARSGDVRFISEARLRTEGDFRWSVQVQHQGASRRVGLVPDAVFALEGIDGNRAFYFVEADRGTMPVRRDSLAQSSFFRKLLAYAATWNQHLHRRQFNFHRFRVLTVTTSIQRARHLAEAATDLPAGHGLFLFGDVSLLSSDQPLSGVWNTGRTGCKSSLWESHGFGAQ